MSKRRYTENICKRRKRRTKLGEGEETEEKTRRNINRKEQVHQEPDQVRSRTRSLGEEEVPNKLEPTRHRCKVTRGHGVKEEEETKTTTPKSLSTLKILSFRYPHTPRPAQEE